MIDSVGKIFKDARRKKGLSVGEVSKKTKISHSVISAIEEDNFEILTPVYIRSFIKLYAKFLELDVSKVLEAYYEYSGLPKEEEEKKKLKTEEPQPVAEEVPLRSISDLIREKRKLILTLFIVFALFLVINLIYTAPVVKTSKPKAEAIKQATDSQKEKGFFSGVKPGELLRLSVRAKADCWIRVKVDDKLIFQDTLKKGGFENWQAKEKIELKLGNPSGVDLELNGRLLEQFGKRTTKARYITITKQGVRLGR